MTYNQVYINQSMTETCQQLKTKAKYFLTAHMQGCYDKYNNLLKVVMLA